MHSKYLFLMAHHCKCCYKIDIFNEINNIVVVIIQHAEEIILCSLACRLRKDRKTGGDVRRDIAFAASCCSSTTYRTYSFARKLITKQFTKFLLG